jgi:hypothetical protein
VRSPALEQGGGVRLIAFLQGWDLLRDELGRPPTLDEYARRFALDLSAALADLRRFEQAFGPGDPDQVLDLLWGWHQSRVKGTSELPIGRG